MRTTAQYGGQGSAGPGAEPQTHRLGRIPGRVMAAFNFVAMSNQSMIPVFAGQETPLLERELHPSQEQAFREACLLLARYFKTGEVEYGQERRVPPGQEGGVVGAVPGVSGTPRGRVWPPGLQL